MPRRRPAAVAVAVLVTLAAAAPAAAADPQPLPTTSTTVAASARAAEPAEPDAWAPDPSADASDGPTPPGVSAAELTARYAGLSAALVGYHAQQRGMTVAEFYAANTSEVAALFGIDAAAAGDRLPPPANLAAFEAAFAAAKAGAVSASTSIEDYAVAVAAVGSVDADIIGSAAGFATAIAAARAAEGDLELPTLRKPVRRTVSLPRVDHLLASPPESLAFGLFADRALTRMVTDFPDVFGDVARSGLATPAARDAWNASVARAASAVRADVTAGILSPCQAAMIAAMAGTSPAAVGGAGCGACVTAGAYLRPRMADLLNPTSGSLIADPRDGILTLTEWNGLTSRQRRALLDQNPGLADELRRRANGTQAAQRASAECAAASAATRGGFGSALGGLVGRLGA